MHAGKILTHEIINLKKMSARAKLVVHAYYPNRLKTEAGEQQVPGWPGLHRKTLVQKTIPKQ